MLRRTNQLFGYLIEARDGRLGKVEDFYFDDSAWRVRYLVAETGGWLTRKDVLISPAALDTPRPDENCFPVRLTRDQVRNSPEVDTDQPVSRQMEESMGLYYGWPSWWAALLPASATPELAAGSPPIAVAVGPAGDPHLRSVREVTGYKARATDAEEGIGVVEDFLLDDDDWTVRYVIVRASLNEKELVLNPWWTREIDWQRREMYFDLRASQIQSSPSLDPDSLVGRDFEAQLHEHFNRPAYWRE